MVTDINGAPIYEGCRVQIIQAGGRVKPVHVGAIGCINYTSRQHVKFRVVGIRQGCNSVGPEQVMRLLTEVGAYEELVSFWGRTLLVKDVLGSEVRTLDEVRARELEWVLGFVPPSLTRMSGHYYTLAQLSGMVIHDEGKLTKPVTEKLWSCLSSATWASVHGIKEVARG